VWIVGADSGFCWSFAVHALAVLYRVDASGGGPHPCAGLPVAIGHVARGHPHALRGRVPRTGVPPLPEGVVAYLDSAGDIQTTIAGLPAVVGTRVQVRIGRVSARAVVGHLGRPVPRGRLMLSAPDEPRSLAALSLGGGSAAERFAYPRPGTAVQLRPVALRDRARLPGGQRPPAA
jgi:hypothetical protein